MSDESQDHMKNSATWIRGLSYLLFFALLTVVSPIAILVSLYGWIMLLWTGRTPEPVINFGATLADWYRSTVRYITANSMRRPFPFEDLDLPRDEPAPARKQESGPSKEPVRRSEAPKPSSTPVSASPAKPSPSAEERGKAPAEREAAQKGEAATSDSTTTKPSKKAAKKIAKKTAKKTARKTAKKAGKKTAGKVGKKASKKTGKKATGKTAKKVAGKTVDDASPPSEEKLTDSGSAPSGESSGPEKKTSDAD